MSGWRQQLQIKRTALALHACRFRQPGFSLVEIAIVLLIVALLLGGLLPTLSGQVEQQRRSDTRKQMDEILQALVGYAASQQPPKLPCPAQAGIATGSANAGVSNCTITLGVVPWVTLGTSETDAWGRRFTYSVTSAVTGPVTSASGFTLASTGNLNVLNTNGGSNIATNIPAVIISHGKNGCGAYLSNGTQLSIAAGNSSGSSCDNAGADQVANTNGTPFVSHDPSPTFDDLVAWLSPNTLFNRMVAAGKLP